jgi:predicted transposase/invertase (TIGR01784 family)
LQEDEEAWRVKIIDIKKESEEGKIEMARKTARELKKKGIDIHIIAEASGLSKEEIEKL